jgi:hypothetical protein
LMLSGHFLLLNSLYTKYTLKAAATPALTTTREKTNVKFQIGQCSTFSIVYFPELVGCRTTILYIIRLWLVPSLVWESKMLRKSPGKSLIGNARVVYYTALLLLCSPIII